MNDTELMLINIKVELVDEGVFSEDQIKSLQDFADRLDRYIDCKIENFAQRNF